MSERVKGRSKHIVDGTIKEIKKTEKVEEFKRSTERKNIFSRFMNYIRGNKGNE